MHITKALNDIQRWFLQQDVEHQLEITIPSNNWQRFMVAFQNEIGPYQVFTSQPDDTVAYINGCKFVKGPPSRCPTCDRPH